MILVGGERERQQKPPYLFVHKNLLLRKTIPGILYAYENNTGTWRRRRSSKSYFIMNYFIAAVSLVTCTQTHIYKSRLQQIDRSCIVYQSFFKYNFINRQDYMEKIHIYVYIKDNTFKV